MEMGTKWSVKIAGTEGQGKIANTLTQTPRKEAGDREGAGKQTRGKEGYSYDPLSALS